MKRIHVALGLAAVAASFFAVRAFAGYKQSYQVSVNTSSRIAYGNAGAARASADLNQYIGCSVSQSGGTSESLSGYCAATDAGNLGGFCFLPSATADSFIKVLQTVGNNPYYYFTWDANGYCTYLFVDGFSYERPITTP